MSTARRQSCSQTIDVRRNQGRFNNNHDYKNDDDSVYNNDDYNDDSIYNNDDYNDDDDD